MADFILKPPSPCHLPSVQENESETVEAIVEKSEAPPLEYRAQDHDFSTGQARKRAIAILIVLTNLVPVLQPIRLYRTR